jgi:large subunit ribosomal protein L29
MKIEKIRELSATELSNELMKMKKELFNLRFQHVTGQLENPIKMRDVKKSIARVKTVIRENEIKNAKA